MGKERARKTRGPGAKVSKQVGTGTSAGQGVADRHTEGA